MVREIAAQQLLETQRVAFVSSLEDEADGTVESPCPPTEDEGEEARLLKELEMLEDEALALAGEARSLRLKEVEVDELEERYD